MTKRRGAWALLAAYVLVVAWILLNPDGEFSRDGSATAMRLASALHLPSFVVVRAEFFANVAITAPLPVLGTLAVGRRRVGTWVTVAFVASLSVEAIQNFVYTDRVGDYGDIVANTAGALLGAVVAWLARRVLAGRLGSRHRPRPPGPQEVTKR